MWKKQTSAASRKAESPQVGALLESPYVVPMVSRAFEILELLRNGVGLPVNEIASRTGIAKSSVYRIVHTMLAFGYVTRSGDGRFRLTEEKELARAQTRIEEIRKLLRRP